MKRKLRRPTAWALLLVMCAEVGRPMAFALSSGPTQPEVQGFQPASADQMVDLFSGDMSYNIPLMDVEGYPLNLFYNAGMGMDQEASWVGAGWNLNVGTVDRSLRGVPDDFNGESIQRDLNIRPNRSFGLGYGVGVQLFGSDMIGLNINISPSFNNYYGPAFDTGLSLTLQASAGSNCGFNAALGLNSSSNRGLSLQPRVGFDVSQSKGAVKATAGLNFGLNIDSRQGLTNYSIGVTASASAQKSDTRKNAKGETEHYYVKDKKDKKFAGSLGSQSIRASFDVGHPTYTPQISMPMENSSLAVAFTVGGEVYGTHPNMSLSGFYSEQRLRSKFNSVPAYGYMYLDQGQLNDRAMLDINREKDGPYSGDRAGLPLAALTNDVFSVSGQGVSGSYRAYRAEVGHVFDGANSSDGVGADLSGEIGAGNAVHVGANVVVNSSNSNSGVWASGNMARAVMRYRSTTNNPLYERVFFREANEATVEQDPNIWNVMQGASPMRFTLPPMGQFDHMLGMQLTQGGSEYTLPGTNYRTKREPRAQLFSYLTHGEMADKFGLDLVAAHAGGFTPPSHHMSEVSITNTEGMRYVYGIPAYNKVQYDVEFNVAGTGGTDGSVTYSGTENSTDNNAPRDFSYSRSRTPAYAYAFLLTAQLSPDYSDVDGFQGPTAGDLGTYTKFSYGQKHADFPWRTPAYTSASKGRFTEGLHGTDLDDQATYVYGEKEIWYLDTIETRNYIAVFHRSDRKDALGVKEDGTEDGSKRLSRLDSIELFERTGLLTNPGAAVPLKTVHFGYDETYMSSLCRGVPNHDVNDGGKLTLKKVWFTYGKSALGYAAPYKFDYGPAGTDNPRYDMLAQDRWGSARPNVESGTFWSQFAGMTDAQHTRNADYPYAEQNPAVAKQLAAAWCLKKITLPTGGTIEVNYEADDYAYVQNRRAMRMFKIDGVTTSGDGELNENEEFTFNIPTWSIPAGASVAEIAATLRQGIDLLYFRFKVNAKDASTYDYVSGYAEVDQLVVSEAGGIYTGKLRLKDVGIDEGASPEDTNPISRAAIEFFQVNYSHLVHAWDGQQEWTGDDNANVGADFFYAMITSVSGLVSGIDDFFEGPNRSVLDDHSNQFNKFKENESYVRLNVPNHRKFGGGHRVSAVRLLDNWQSMEDDEQDEAFTYGTDYQYGDENGSWGVASFEPLTGADENPFRKPIYTTVSKALSPDDRFYQEEPFGETFFPSPQVGYSKVIVTDHFPDAGSQATQGTGKSVHEYYTAKDFPTITARTGIDPQRRKNSFNALALLGFDVIDHMHASQGYSIETNDMHGKPKLISVYPEGSDQAISTEEYTYACTAMGDAYRLVNTLKTIDANGQVADKDIGLQYEFVADMREFVNKNTSGGVQVNVETFIIGIVPVPIPIILPTYSSSSTRYKTGVLVKKVHRFGQLTKVTRMSNGSQVVTENLARDAVTGGVLLTKVQNGFEDPIYSMSYPAYWYYDGMGPAYANMGARFGSLTFNTNGWATVTDAAKYFSEADELAIWPTGGGSPVRGWVADVEPGSIHVIDRNGNNVSATGAVKVLRSGRRNMQTQNMMDLTLQHDPLATLASNAYSAVLDSKVKVFGNVWRTECACEEQGEGAETLNDYLLGRKGQWRLHKEMVWLTERTRSNYDYNTNIRRDGVYTAFAPYYQLQTGDWTIAEAGWTTAREVTLYNRRGTELENRDALGLYSAASFGFDGSLPTAVARNARYAEILTDNFEEGMIGDCTTRRWEIDAPLGVTNTAAHTGRWSVRASEDDPVIISMDLWSCPPPGCDLDLYISPNSSQIIASMGTPPYNFSYEVLAGNGTIDLQLVAPNELNVVASTMGSMYIVRFTVEDANGCKTSRTWSDY
ncbi:MAG: hypothetical protein KA175_01325 [Flavobacteriales bacterium]|nr:hypothetical protein [Flavobacteriales bacterium]MBP6696226.1 hypothetical protein [Flavobacteriales bacterium]